MDQEDEQFFADVEFPSLPVVVETGDVEVVEVEPQDDAEAIGSYCAGCCSTCFRGGNPRG